MLRERLLQKGLSVDDPGAGDTERGNGALPQTAAEPRAPFFGPIFPFDATETSGDSGLMQTQPFFLESFVATELSKQRARSRASAHSEQQASPAKSPTPVAGDAGASPVFLASNPGGSRAPSPPVRQNQRRGRAAKSNQPENGDAAAFKAVCSGRVSKPRKPGQPDRPEEAAEPAAPTADVPLTSPRRSRRLQVASQGEQATKVNDVLDQPSPVRRGPKPTTGGMGKQDKAKPVGATKTGLAKSRGRRQRVA